MIVYKRVHNTAAREAASYGSQGLEFVARIVPTRTQTHWKRIKSINMKAAILLDVTPAPIFSLPSKIISENKPYPSLYPGSHLFSGIPQLPAVYVALCMVT